MSDSWRLAFPIAGTVLVLDQLSKFLIERALSMLSLIHISEPTRPY